jgi:hypothetical protein
LNGYNYGNTLATFAQGIVCSPFTPYTNISNQQQYAQEQLAQVEMAIKGKLATFFYHIFLQTWSC